MEGLRPWATQVVINLALSGAHCWGRRFNQNFWVRLMETDERATVATLDAYRAVFQERVAGHGGRIVDTAGDSVLAVFGSVVEAAQSAFEVQGWRALGFSGTSGCGG